MGLWALLVATQSVAETQGVRVSVSPVDSLIYLPTYSAPATAVSLNESRLSVETSGRILGIPVHVGDSVESDGLLAELECSTNRSAQREAAAQVSAAKAQLTLAERQIKRTRILMKERNVSEEILNQREAELLTAQANIAARQAALENADLAVRHCRITAPFAGVVTQRLANEGEWITPGQPLVRLLDTERLEVSAQIPLGHIDSLKQAPQYDLAVAGKRYQLSLRRLLPAIDSLARNQEARFEFIGKRALPGSSGRLLWQATHYHLPADIPVRRNGQLGVFVEADGIAHFKVLPGALEGIPAPTDLPPGTVLIIEGRHGLSDGDPVIPQN